MNLREKNLEREGKLRQDILDLLIKYNKETGILVESIYISTHKITQLGLNENLGTYTKLEINSYVGLLMDNTEE